MSLASIASSLSSVRDRIRAALTSKGLNVSSGVTLNQTADLIEALPSSGAVDVTSTTAQAADVRAGRIFVNSGGVQVSGTMPDAAVTSNSSGVTVSSGYLSSSVHIDPVVSSGGTEVTLGYITSGGEFQPLTFSGTNATNNGSAITLSCYTWNLPVSSHSWTSSGAIITSGNTTVISGGQSWYDTTVSQGGMLVISSGGSADTTTIDELGRITVYSGGTASILKVSGGASAVFYGSARIDSNCYGTTTSATIDNGVMVLEIGSASGVTLHNGGRLVVSSGGIAEDVAVTAGCEMWIYPGGSASSVVLSSSYIYPDTQCIVFGGAITSVTVYANVMLEVTGNADIGKADNVKVESGGNVLFTSNTSGNVVIVSSGGAISAYSGSVLSNVLLYPGATSNGILIE